MPGPSSMTANASPAGARPSTSSRTSPAAGAVCSIALRARLRSACASRSGRRAATPSGTGPSSKRRSAVRLTPVPELDHERAHSIGPGAQEVGLLGLREHEQIVDQPTDPRDLRLYEPLDPMDLRLRTDCAARRAPRAARESPSAACAARARRRRRTRAGSRTRRPSRSSIWLNASASTRTSPPVARRESPSAARARRRQPAWPPSCHPPQRRRYARAGEIRGEQRRARASRAPASTNAAATPCWARSTIASGSPAPTMTATMPAASTSARGCARDRHRGRAESSSRGAAPAAPAPSPFSVACSAGVRPSRARSLRTARDGC